ncbi:MAG: hypothetical protein H0X37_24150 [Herpetosiphonaceae bacterium]|nr:hypothetical protein [Herpetosiphonaceae bacterium]
MTTNLVFAHTCIILDASCTINLFASGQMDSILTAIPRSVAVAAYVREQEALRINVRSGDGETRILQPIDLQPLIDRGLLIVVAPASEDENESYVNFAAVLGDDGEAITAAIALHRNWASAIDDRSATNLFRREAPQLQIISTPELIKHWVDAMNPADAVVRLALEDVRAGARYAPGRQHPLYEWWHGFTTRQP